MKSRLRAAAFAAGALTCAGLSAAAAGAGQEPAAESFGPLRLVAVTSAPLDRATRFGPRVLKRALSERRVPESFVPPDAVASPEEAFGRELATSLPAGSYLTASALRAPTAAQAGRGRLPDGTTPVEIVVTGAGALASTRTASGDRVDVVVSGDSAPGPTSSRTYIAAAGIELIGLRESAAEPGLGSDRWIATLAATRAQALRLIRAESAGAQLRLLGA